MFLRSIRLGAPHPAAAVQRVEETLFGLSAISHFNVRDGRVIHFSLSGSRPIDGYPAFETFTQLYDAIHAVLVEQYGPASSERHEDHRRDEEILAEGRPDDRAFPIRYAEWSSPEHHVYLTLAKEWPAELRIGAGGGIKT
jgi:hypothetical protein